MQTQIVLFNRYPEEDADYVPANPTTADHFAQLARELDEAGLCARFLRALWIGNERIVFAAALDYDGNLETRLAEAYETYGIAGGYTVAATATNVEPLA